MSPKLLSSARSPAVSMLFSRSVVVGRGMFTTRAATAACAAAWADSMPPKVVAGAGRAALGFPEVNLEVGICGERRGGGLSDAESRRRERSYMYVENNTK